MRQFLGMNLRLREILLNVKKLEIWDSQSVQDGIDLFLPPPPH